MILPEDVPMWNVAKSKDLEAFYEHKAVCSDSYTGLLQACLELLRQKQPNLVVVAPITAPVEFMNAVVRSGVHPAFTDITEDLQLDVGPATELFKQDIPAVVFNNCIASVAMSSGVTAFLADKISIVDTGINAFKAIKPEHVNGTYNLFRFYPASTGCMLVHTHSSMLRDLRRVRAGAFATFGHIEAQVQGNIIDTFTSYESSVEVNKAVRTALVQEIVARGFGHIVPKMQQQEPSTMLLSVKSAREAVKWLGESRLSARLPVKPLHVNEDLADMWPDDIKNFPVATAAMDKYLEIPTHVGVSKHIDSVVKLLLEVAV